MRITREQARYLYALARDLGLVEADGRPLLAAAVRAAIEAHREDAS